MLEKLIIEKHPSDTGQKINYQPDWLIATTDLTYGLLLGHTKDGLVIVRGDSPAEVYRGRKLAMAENFDIAHRAATSGAFPVAFPPKSTGISVLAGNQKTHNFRPLNLADGGIGDNLGLLLLQAARDLSCKSELCEPGQNQQDRALPKNWNLDAILVSDGGSISGVASALTLLQTISRVVDIAGSLKTPKRNVDTVHFSPSNSYLSPLLQFRLFSGTQEPDISKWSVGFHPHQLPHSILQAVIALSPADQRADANDTLQEISPTISSLAREQVLDWTRELRKMKSMDACPTNSPDGFCKTLDLKRKVEADIRKHFAEFSKTSTLQDNMSEEKIDSLFRLGQYLVFIQWRRIERALFH